MGVKFDLLANVPGPSAKRIALRVRPEAERAIGSGHPWLYAQAIKRQSHEGAAGDLAVIFDRKGRFLAVGLYDPTSPIRVRILHHGRPTAIDDDWLLMKLVKAKRIREPLLEKNSTAYRWVHGENDGLPGLVVDRYADTYVLKLYTSAWIVHLRQILQALHTLCTKTGKERFILRLSRQVQAERQALFGLQEGMILSGEPVIAPVVFRENGFRFACDPIRGQKTGFFLDQRENRERVEKLAPGRSVLNVFAYSGGFSLYAARGGAKEVTSLDLSRPALEMAAHHFAMNLDFPGVAAAKHQTIEGDAFARLEALARQGAGYDMVILDPPAFARSQDGVAKALNAYRRLARLGIAVLRQDGILVASSCSRPVTAEDFFAAVHAAAAGMKRPLSEIERTGHALDHPVGFSEGAYLKCLFAQAA